MLADLPFIGVSMPLLATGHHQVLLVTARHLGVLAAILVVVDTVPGRGDVQPIELFLR